MKADKRFTLVSCITLFTLFFSLLIPTGVLADDSTPPPDGTSEVVEPQSTQPATATEEPTEEPTVEPAATEEPIASEMPAATEEAALDEGVSEVDLAAIVTAAADMEIILADDSGDPLDLGTVEAVDILTSGDPYFTVGATTYHFYQNAGDCAVNGYGGVFGTECFESSTPIQDAIDYVWNSGSPLTLTDDTIHVEAGTYNEQLTIYAELSGLILYGDPGGLTTAGAGASAPTLAGDYVDGNCTITALEDCTGGGEIAKDIAVKVDADDFTIIGFIIQGYDVGLDLLASGQAIFAAENNTIQDNGIGIFNENSVPGVDLHYNIFQNNDYAIKNVDTGGSQYINAWNNYWGCPEGPVVEHTYQDNGQNGAWHTYYYQYSPGGPHVDPNNTGSVDEPNDYVEYLPGFDPALSDCDMIFGDNEQHWNHNPFDWSPFKIIIGCEFGEIYTPTGQNTFTCTPVVCEPGQELNETGDGCEDIPAYCGDGNVDAGEQCDDGNTDDFDSCNNSCVLTYCGDGIVNGTDQCDDGNQINNDACTNACTTPACGDGIVNGTDQCDDGNDINNDSCTNTCTTPTCGDGIVNGTDQCDDGNQINNDACTNVCTTPTCGDGIVNGTDQCDDGNTTGGDSCSATCTIEACGNGVLDPGEQCDLGGANSDTGACTTSCELPSCGDGFIQPSNFEFCDDGNLQNGDGCSATCTVEPTCGDGLINVDGEQCDDGNTVGGDGCSAVCTIEPRCGDGNIDPQLYETCDDGNTTSGDGCSATCTLETCGDGIQQTGEACDDGNQESGDGCSTTCTVEACGNGVVDAGEACDDGNLESGDGCSATCTVEACGNGVLDLNEQCDDGNQVNTDGCTNTCTVPSCGDGIVQPSNYEACDDGNDINDDGCTNECALPACGDGIVNGTEQCDDGNTNDGDGCSEICTLEESEAFCGDGVVNLRFETCDDGNNVSGDGCSATCGDEPPPPPPVIFTNGAVTPIIPVTGGEPHAITAGIAHTCAITPEGGVQCWGNNDFGQLGDGTNESSNVPVDVIGFGGVAGGAPGLSQISKAWTRPAAAGAASTIVAGGNHTCVISGGDVWCWGQNGKGQIGDGTTENRNKPVMVLSGAADITAGLDYTCAIMFNGQVMCWGNNAQGQLADGTTTDHLTPSVAKLITGLSNVDAGQNKDCGITSTGLLRCVTNVLGQLFSEPATPNLDVAVSRFGNLIVALDENGVPVEFKSGKPQLYEDLSGSEDVDSGVGHVCALLSDGTVSCWGSNNYGQLGNDSTKNNPDPGDVVDLSGAYQLAVGKNHVCVLIPNGTPGQDDIIKCWGLNTDGQLGNGSNENSSVPVVVK